jgi:hypothetical protein
MKYQTLSNELFNVKRDKLLYEREFKTLNDDNELLNSIRNKNNYDSDEKKENNENENNNDDENNQNDDDLNKKDVIPQNKHDKIQYYKNTIAEFNKERDDLNNIFNKMPSRPRKKEQITTLIILNPIVSQNYFFTGQNTSSKSQIKEH